MHVCWNEDIMMDNLVHLSYHTLVILLGHHIVCNCIIPQGAIII